MFNLWGGNRSVKLVGQWWRHGEEGLVRRGALRVKRGYANRLSLPSFHDRPGLFFRKHEPSVHGLVRGAKVSLFDCLHLGTSTGCYGEHVDVGNAAYQPTHILVGGHYPSLADAQVDKISVQCDCLATSDASSARIAWEVFQSGFTPDDTKPEILLQKIAFGASILRLERRWIPSYLEHQFGARASYWLELNLQRPTPLLLAREYLQRLAVAIRHVTCSVAHFQSIIFTINGVENGYFLLKPRRRPAEDASVFCYDLKMQAGLVARVFSACGSLGTEPLNAVSLCHRVADDGLRDPEMLFFDLARAFERLHHFWRDEAILDKAEHRRYKLAMLQSVASAPEHYRRRVSEALGQVNMFSYADRLRDLFLDSEASGIFPPSPIRDKFISRVKGVRNAVAHFIKASAGPADYRDMRMLSILCDIVAMRLMGAASAEPGQRYRGFASLAAEQYGMS